MGAAKDFIIATVILAVCVLLLVQVFGKTDQGTEGQPRIPEQLASNDTGTSLRGSNGNGTGNDGVRVPQPLRATFIS